MKKKNKKIMATLKHNYLNLLSSKSCIFNRLKWKSVFSETKKKILFQ